MGVGFVNGMQGDNPKYYRVISTPKHFAVHSGPESTRHTADVTVSKHDELDSYLPAFHATVTEAEVDSIMCAYNSITGEPTCANQFLLQDQLRAKVRREIFSFPDYLHRANCSQVFFQSKAFSQNANVRYDLKCRKYVLSDISEAAYICEMGEKHPPRLKRIGLLLFDGITALDVVGPMETFATAWVPNNGSKRSCYELLTIGLTKKEVVAESGLILRPGTTLATCPKLDTLIIPGGRGLREARTNRTVAKWIKNRAATTRRIVSVCTGIFGLAPTGLLDKKTVTTHWRFAQDLSRNFPALEVDANALFLTDGHFYTSAGITAGIDLSLALIEEDFGRAAALMVARELVVFMKRPGGQEQYSEPLQFQIESTDRTHDVIAYIRSNLKKDLSVGVLASFAHLSPRQFSRKFTAAFCRSPAAYVEGIRLDEARKRLCETQCNIDQLAVSVGFRSDDAFRRAFVRRFGVSPGNYRTRFGERHDE